MRAFLLSSVATVMMIGSAAMAEPVLAYGKRNLAKMAAMPMWT